MSRIHVVFTGGTIGSTATTRLQLREEPPRELVEVVLREDPNAPEMTVAEPFRILSEDATPAHWETLARYLAGIPLAGLDGLVVAHGSDTLAWTAAALAVALAGIPVPVVLVAADRPLADPRGNGFVNFRAALRFILEERLPGVFVVWAHPGEAPGVHLASRILPADPFTDRFTSAAGVPFGEIGPDGFRRNPHPANPGREAVHARAEAVRWKASRQRILPGGAVFARAFLSIPASPGLDYARLTVEDLRWKAVLQQTFHSGTAPSHDAPGSLVEFARRALGAGVPLLLGPCRSRNVPYASLAPLLEAGARLVPAMSLPAAETKIRYLLGTQGHLAGLDADLALERLDLETD